MGFGYFYVPIKNDFWLDEALKVNAVAVYNHISPLDGFILASYVHPFSAVINSVHGSMALLQPIVEKLRYILVDYNQKGLGQAAKLIDHIKNGKNMLAIAPEGSTTNGKMMMTFRTGAFVPLAPIMPILIRYPYRCTSPAWTRTSIITIMCRLLTQFVNFARL
jgi:lysophosphatidylcholine acyltransferase/lyso-PAF acetyltransferase